MWRLPSTSLPTRSDASCAGLHPHRGLALKQLAAADDEHDVWIADCDVVRQLDARTNAIVRTIPIPGATGAGARGIAIGDGVVWAQAGPPVRIDPKRGAVVGITPLDRSLVWGEYAIAIGFGSIWVRQQESVVRVRP